MSQRTVEMSRNRGSAMHATDKLSEARDAALRPWLYKVEDLVANRLADARAHAQLGDWRRAEERLGELGRDLGDKVLGPGRERFLHDAFQQGKIPLPPGHPGRALEPTPGAVRVARETPIGAEQIDQYADLRRRVDQAGRELQVERLQPHVDTLRVWELRHGSAIARAARTHLSDAQVALHEAVGRLLVEASDVLQ